MPTPLYEGSIDESARDFFIAAQQGQVELLDPLFDAGVEVNALVRVRLCVGQVFGHPIGESVHETVSSSPCGPGIEGLIYQSIPGDGHCLFNAVALHIEQDQTTLRNVIAAHIEHHLDEFRARIEAINPSRTAEQYLEALRSGEEWADNLEITVLMRLLNRPIAVVGPDGRVRNSVDLEGFDGEPIFVYYNGHDHYDAYLLQEGWQGRSWEILASLTEFNEHAPIGPALGMVAAGAGMVNIINGEVIQGNSPMHQIIEATALYIAVQNGHLAAVKKLMELGADPKIAASNRLAPFYLAMDLAKMDIVNEFLALEDADDLRTIVNLAGPMSDTPLSIAGLRMGDFALMTDLLLKGANVNALIGVGSLLFHALSQDRFDLARFLLARDDIDVTVDTGVCALLPLALKKRKFDIAATLVAKGADVNQRQGPATLFFTAAHKADFDALRFLAGFEQTDLSPEFAGATPIFMAAQKGRLDVAEVLLDFERTDVNRECCGVTPIYISAQNGHFELVRALIAAGAHLRSSIIRPSPLMATPLSAAVRKGHPEIASMLADHLKILLERQVAEMSARAGAAGPGLFAEPPELIAAKALLKVYKAEAGEDTVKEHAAVLKRSDELRNFFSDLKPYLTARAGLAVAGAAAGHGAGH